MKNYKKQIYLFLYISLCIVISSFTVLFLNFRKQVRFQNEILKIETNLMLSDTLTNSLLQIESDKRGFLLTNDVSYLVNFNSLKNRCYETVRSLKRNNFSLKEKNNISQIDSLLKIRIANLDSGIAVFTSKGFKAAVEFMQIKDKKDIRELLTQQLQLLKNNLLQKSVLNTSSINMRSNRNLSGLFILLLIFILLMLVAASTFRRAQQKIIKNHEKFKEAQRIAKIGSWEWDFSTNKLTWSQEQFRLFGQDRKTFDLTYDGYLSHLSGKEQENTAVLIKEAIDGIGRFAVEHEITRKDGTVVMVFEQGTILLNENKKPIGMFGTSQDITERKKAEEELVEAKQKVQSIFDNSADGIYQSTIDGKFIMANPSMARIFGYDSPETLISSITDIGEQIYANSADRKRMSEFLLANDHINNFEVQLLSKNREIIWVSESTRIVRNKKGALLYLEGTVKEITERKKAEAALALAQSKFQEIFDNTADGIYQSTVDGKFIIANPSMAKIFGYDSAEDLISSVTDISSQIYADPEERKKMSEIMLEKGHVEDFELQVLTKTKDIIWVSANIRIVHDEKGAISYFEGTLEDITGRKKAELELLNMSNRLQLAIDATNIGIWDWDIVKNKTVWDEEMYKIYNVNPKDMVSISAAWEAAIHPDDLERVNGELKLAINGEKNYDTEFRVVWKDKTLHYVKGHALVQRDQSGNPLRLIGTNADITQRKEAEQEILVLNQNLDQFANITAHDLQEPIRMVSGFLGLLEKKYNDKLDEQGKSYVYRAKDGADRMSILIRDLLEFSRSGNKAAKKESIDLAVVMDLVNKDLSIVLADTGALLQMPEFLPVVTGTQSALYRLFLNLISNGIKFRKKDAAPVIKLSVTEQPDFWEFALQDNGIGVAEKDQSKLFHAFQRLHRRDEYPGTGLGLVTCKKIVEIHGGKIGMTSEVGKGTTFRFSISKN